MNDGSIEALDLMAGGDITQKGWADIKNICLNYSRATMKKGRGLRDLPHKSNGGSGVSKMELSNLLFDFKHDIINDVTTQLDSMQERRKKEELDVVLAEFCSHCREKKRNCKYRTVASVDINSMPIDFKSIDEENREFFYVAQRHPWAQRQGMPPDPLNNFGYNNNNSQWPNHNPQNFAPQGQNWNYNWSNQ